MPHWEAAIDLAGPAVLAAAYTTMLLRRVQSRSFIGHFFSAWRVGSCAMVHGTGSTIAVERSGDQYLSRGMASAARNQPMSATYNVFWNYAGKYRWTFGSYIPDAHCTPYT